MSAFELVEHDTDHLLRAIVFASPAFPLPAVADASGAAALTGQPVRVARFSTIRELNALYDAILAGDEQIGTLIIDSLSLIYDIVTHHYIDIGDKVFFRRRQDTMCSIVRKGASLPCHVIFLAREKTLYARPGEVIGGVVVGPDDNVAIGGVPDTDRTNEYYVDMVARVIAKESGPVLSITASRLPELAVESELPCHFDALAATIALAAPAQFLAPPRVIEAAAPASALEPETEPHFDQDVAPVPVNAQAEPTPHPSSENPESTRTLTAAPVPAQATPLALPEHDETALNALREAFAKLAAVRTHKLGVNATRDPRFTSLSTFLRSHGVMHGPSLSPTDVPKALAEVQKAIAATEAGGRQIQPPSHLAS